MSEIVNGLWIKGSLSSLELLTIQSFISNGFIFQLWTYEPDLINAPENCIIKNASEIIAENEIFCYQTVNKYGHGKGSYAGFSDIFRYKLLYKNGGIWTDMDITCLQSFIIKEDYFFRYHHKSGAVGNFMKCPKNSELMKWCYCESIKKINATNKDWMLPIKILNNGIQKYHLSNFIIKISNDDSFPEVSKLLSSKKSIPQDWKIIHWMNEEFRRLSISKTIFLPNTTLHFLLIKNNINHTLYKDFEILKHTILLSRYYYLLKNIKSTLNWHLLSR